MTYLTNTGALALSFINKVFTLKYRLSRIVLTKLYKLRLANDKFTLNITYIALLKYGFNNHIDEIWYLII